MLPRDRIPAYDSGYGTRSRKISSVTSLPRMFDTCDIPLKRSRLSLPGINDSLTCKTEDDDFNFGISPCSTSNFDKLLKTVGSISYDADSTMANKSIVQKDETKSHYFKEKEQEFESKAFVVNMLYM